MSTQRAHIVLPEDLVQQIDKLVGPRGRSAFLVETARAEVKRRRLIEFLLDPTPAWKDEDHPEFNGGDSAAWVRQLRQEGEHRIPKMPVEPLKKPVTASKKDSGRKTASRARRSVAQ